jgi:hypothetical protein
VPGTRVSLRVETHLSRGPAQLEPAAGVSVEARLAPRPERKGRRGAPARAALAPVTLLRAGSDAAGHVDARVSIPAWPAGTYRLLLVARLGSRRVDEEREVQLVPGGRVLVQSDKPLYQPGQLVHLRAVVIRPLDGRPVGGVGPTAPAVIFEVEDGRGNRVFKERRPLSRFGVSWADFPLAHGAVLGQFKARARVVSGTGAADGAEAGEGKGDSGVAQPGELGFEVSRYRLPRFQVELTTDRQDYRPGQMLEARVKARYHFGPPVARGQVTIHTSADQGTSLPPLMGRLDADGSGRFKIALPAGARAGRVRLRARVEEAGNAASAGEAKTEVEVAESPLLVEAVNESGQLVPGLPNRFHVVATYRDGRPAAGVHLEVALGGARGSTVTDPDGMAEVVRTPDRMAPRPMAACQPDVLEVSARDRQGFTATLKRCQGRAPIGTPLLSTARVLHGAADPIAVTVEVPAGEGSLRAGGKVYVDLLKDGQTLETAVVPMAVTPSGTGRGELVLPPRAERFGSLVVRAYAVQPDGTQHDAARLILVERPGALAVSLSATGARGAATLRPGEQTRLQVQVKDSATGAGVKAQVGLRMVDEALLALMRVKQRSAPLFFHLSSQMARAGERLQARPAGLTVEGLVTSRIDDPLRQRAARVLLASAADGAGRDGAWETTPWEQRRARAYAQDQRLSRALERFADHHVIGERRDGRWDYRRDLLEMMVRAGALSAGDRLDPWGRPLTSERVIKLAGLGAFDSFAAGELDRRLTRIYRALRDRRGRLAADP